MKKNMQLISGILVVLSLFFTRYTVSKYGESSRTLIITIALVIAVIALIGIMCTKNYLAALGLFMMILPLIIMTIGIYIDNIYIISSGFLSIFILIPAMIKIIGRRK